MLLLLLILRHALAFIFSSGYALVFPSFSLPVCLFSFWSRVVVFSMARAPRWSCGAIYLVSRRSVWYRRGALLRGLSQCRCECELVNPCESRSSRVPVVHCLSARSIEEQPWLSVIDLALRGSWGGRDGSIYRGGRIICQLHQLGPPLCSPPHRQPSPRNPRMGLVRGKILFKIFLHVRIII